MPALPFRRNPLAGLLVAALVALLFALPGALAAQTIVTVDPQQCVWHTGDDLAWAAPNLDETGWQPHTDLKQPPTQARLWMRCHTDLSSVRSTAHPAIQVRLDAAYQLYVNGSFIGGAGNINNGYYSMNVIRQYPLSTMALENQAGTVALNVTYRASFMPGDSKIEINAGDLEALNGRRAQVILTESAAPLANAVCFALIGVVGLMLLGLFYYDRSRRELLYLSIECVSLALLRANEFCVAAQMDYSSVLHDLLLALGNIAGPAAFLPFFFALARRRVPRIYWLPVVILTLNYCLLIVTLTPLFSPEQSVWLGTTLRDFNLHTLHGAFEQIIIAAAPFVAFWPFTKIAKRMRPLAAFSMLWGTTSLLWFAIQSTINPLLGLPNLFAPWRPELLAMRAIVSACVLVAFLGLLFRDQRLATEEHALFAGEIRAARDVQQYLIPEHLPPTPGFSIESEYRPAREVGGDFFQILPHAVDGSLLIVVGDVAGKGIEAGMLATLIVGAVRTAATFTSDPARILALLNERLCGRGFVTCLALRVEADGSATLVNAGHLPPYLNGKELAVEGALPLGAVAGIQFPAFYFRLAEGDSMMLMTDGVAEAQDEQGQLFGFGRIGDLLHMGAGGAALAAAAQDFGQQDDITILTLIRMTPAQLASSGPVLSALASA